MKNKNICKFIPETAADTLEMQNFVCERDVSVMSDKTHLVRDRAILITQGAGAFHFDNETVKLTLGSLVFGFKGETFFCEPEDNLEYIYISFGGARANTLFTRFGIYKSNRSFAGFEGMIPMWRESILRASESTIDLAAESALLYALSRFSSEEREKGDVVNKAVTYINENFTEQITLSDVARHCFVSVNQLCILFKTKLFTTVNKYIMSKRISLAKKYLSQGKNVTETAFSVGFNDYANFIRAFKNNVGVSPGKYNA